ncbi:MAG: DNA-binding protein [Proteobacteria bacterium SW_6_67_9]|nr:MAG: DNA-binding protein [Proteobacteria bacterium SW_6_67_9]
MLAPAPTASFRLGQIVRHKEHGYRGVVYDVDPAYQGSDAWLERNVGEAAPTRAAPWYYVIVDEEDAETYVPEQHLEADDSGEPVWHPELDELFHELRDGVYVPRQLAN